MYCHDKYSIFRQGFGKGFADKFKFQCGDNMFNCLNPCLAKILYPVMHMNYKSCFCFCFSEYCDEIITILLLSKLKSPSVETVECVRGNSANLMNPDWNSGWRLRGFLCSLHPSHRDTVHFIQCPVSGHCINCVGYELNLLHL